MTRYWDKELEAAAELGDIERIKQSLDKGSNAINSALYFATEANKIESIQFLCDYVEDVDKAREIIAKASARNGHLYIIQLLHKQGMELNAYSNLIAKKAIGNGHINIIDYLIANGFDIESDFHMMIKLASVKDDRKTIISLLSRYSNFTTEKINEINEILKDEHKPLLKRFLLQKGINQ